MDCGALCLANILKPAEFKLVLICTSLKKRGHQKALFQVLQFFRSVIPSEEIKMSQCTILAQFNQVNSTKSIVSFR